MKISMIQEFLEPIAKAQFIKGKINKLIIYFENLGFAENPFERMKSWNGRKVLANPISDKDLVSKICNFSKLNCKKPNS